MEFQKAEDMRADEIERETERLKFSRYLPWVAYDENTRMYYCIDDTVGFMWECVPVAFAGEGTVSALEGLLKINLPEKSVLQFILYADPHVEPVLENAMELRTKDNPVVRKASINLMEFFRKGQIEETTKIPLRIFRLFVTLKFPADSRDVSIVDLMNAVEETLSASGLLPFHVGPEDLLAFMRRFLNDRAPGIAGSYDDMKEIRDQVILAETEIRRGMKSMYIGSKIMRCLTVKTFPREVNVLQTNELFGGIWGVASDANQITVPFLYTLNIIFGDVKTYLHAKCNLILQQRGFGSLAPSLERKKEEYLWATDEIERGTRFVRVFPCLWVIAPTERRASEAIARVRRMWEQSGYVMQEDRIILPVLFISSLPFGLYVKGRNLENIDRDTITTAEAASRIMPVQADFAGGGRPYLVFVGRKGQLITLDIMDPSVRNSNVLVAASTGSGKSFFCNYLVTSYYACGGIIRIVDIGASYKKLCKIFGGKYLDITEGMCFNPFTNVVDITDDLPAIRAIVMQMAFSKTEQIPEDIAEVAATVIGDAVRWAYETRGKNACIDDVYTYLVEFPKYSESVHTPEIRDVAKTIAFNLRDFTSEGVHGKWFNGPSTFDIAKDDFVVLELQNIVSKRELFRVITLQVINAVSIDLYLSDRTRKRLILFDEAWQFLREANQIREIIEIGYRRARKHGGSFTVITQSILDLKSFGSVGEVIRANSAFKFYLESPDFEVAKKEGLLECDEFELQIMKTVRRNAPRYSEIYMDTPWGRGVARLIVDRYSYYLYSTTPKDVAMIEELVRSGLSYDEAIEKMCADSAS
jgi:conjugal transfer ATP-binding protein TraC